MDKNSTLNYFLIFLFLIIFSFQGFSQSQRTLDIALQHLEEKRQDLQLTQQDISNYKVSDHYASKHNGVTHVYLQQQHQGINVQNALININVLPNEEILNMGNRFVADLASKVNTTEPSIDPIDALQKTVNKFGDTDGSPIDLKERKNDQHYIYENEGIALEPIPVRLIFELQEDNSVRLVWQVRFYTLDAQHMWNTQVDAVTGEILDFYDEVLHCDFSHSHDFCENKNHKSNNTESLTGVPYRNNLSPVMGNTYNVFPLPIESPKHGGRAMVTNPSDTTASPFGWHDTDGVDGEEYTITRGNNVHAYHDIFSQNLSIGNEPDGGAMLEFDYPFSNTNDTVYQQMDAAMTNLFYWNNIIHDMWYHYGLDEASGNFQANNYGNGGVGNDHVRAEALDGSGRNNANFFTPDDGSLPRMQMFIWNAGDFPDDRNEITITDSTGMDTTYVMRPAGFGAPMPTMPVIGELALVDDGAGNVLDACENVGNAFEVFGKIALLERGENGCQFGTQALKAQNAGAIAVVICNNDDNNEDRVFSMIPGDDGDDVTVATLMVSKKTCDILKLDIDNLTITIQAPDFTLADPGPTGLDSDFDNGVIIHEYTHGISNRLTGGPSASSCLRNMEQAGEGWSDWFALVMTTTSADNADEGRGIGTYLRGEGPNGDGIREYRYSRDLTVDPHLYADLGDVAVPHGVGSIWAVTIWDLYWNMVDVYGFDDDLYFGTGGNNMTMQLVLDGLKLQPCSPSFIDSRDAILAADVANYDGAHQCLIWNTFARRGMGLSAVAGGTDRYDIPAECQTRLKISKEAMAEVAAGDMLTYQITVINSSPDTLYNIVITDVLPEGIELIENTMSCGIFDIADRELTIQLGDMLSGDTVVCSYDVLVASEPFSYVDFEDNVENGIDNWVISSAAGIQLWTVNASNSYDGAYAWFSPNAGTATDIRLTSANAHEITAPNARLSFWHAYNTESNRDGGNVEISIDGGNTWIDQRNNFVKNGYNGILLNDFLDGDQGFTADREEYRESVIELNDYQGESVLFRFRFSSNPSGSGDGWYIDNIKLFGNYREVVNEACVSSVLNENVCSVATTVVNGDPITSTEILESELGISIFPNPTEGKVFIKIENDNNTPTILKLVGLDGRLLKTKEIEFSNGLMNFDLAEFPKGIYMLQIQTGEQRLVRKIVLQN